MNPLKKSVSHKNRAIAAMVALTFLGGCATFSKDNGLSTVQSATKARGLEQDVQWIKTEQDGENARATVKKLLAAPLTADTAVQIALLNNRGLQATYAELGIAEADVVQAGRLVNPGFTFERLHRGDDVSIDRTFLFNILGLITMPIRTDIEKRRFALTQGRVAAETLQTAADTRRAWHSAVAAQESVKYMEQVRMAAESSAELARRMAAVGNFSKLDQAREQSFYAEATAQLARVKQQTLVERERLIRLLGLWGEDIAFKLPERLPDLPKTPRDIVDLESTALRQRLDVQGAMQEAENIASTMGLTKATGFVNVLEVGYRRNSETGQPRQTGYEIELRLPIFDWGNARRDAMNARSLAAANRYDSAVRNATSQVRESYSAYRTAYDVARHYRDEIVPLRKTMADENLLRYNGMLIGVFELLADNREQISAVLAALNAHQQFWLADAALSASMTGKPTAMGAMSLAGGGAAAEAGH